MKEVILHIETATKICSVAVSEAGNTLAFHEEHPDNYVHGEQLTLFIEKVCNNAHIQLSDLDAVSSKVLNTSAVVLSISSTCCSAFLPSGLYFFLYVAIFP